MDWITFVKKENVSKAENTLRNDFDVVARQSITVRDARALGIEDDGSFIMVSGTEEGVNKAKELIKDDVAESKDEDLEKAKAEIKAEEEKAAEGFGGIFG